MPKRSAANVHDNVNAAEKELCHLPLDWEGGSDPKAQVQIFLVTAAKLVNDREDSADAAKVDDDVPPLVDPASVSKDDLRKAIQDSVQNPIYDVVVHICCRAFWHNCSSGRWALQRNCLGAPTCRKQNHTKRGPQDD